MSNNLREEILAPYIKKDGSSDECKYFSDVPLSTLQRLIDLGYVEMGEWNSCSGVTEMFLPFLKRNPLFTAHGYMITEERDDSRITIEGVERDGLLTISEVIDFCCEFMRSADDISLNIDYAYCWYD